MRVRMRVCVYECSCKCVLKCVLAYLFCGCFSVQWQDGGGDASAFITGNAVAPAAVAPANDLSEDERNIKQYNRTLSK